MKGKVTFLIALMMISCVVVAFASVKDKGSPMERKTPEVKASAAWSEPNKAWAIIEGTQEGSEITGRADFVETGDGVQVVINVSNVTPGKHGIHIHANGSCDEGGKAAGGHFNPDGTPHGLLARDGHEKAHTGDMGNIEIDDSGKGMLSTFLAGLSLSQGSKNVVEKAVILHEKEDDFGQPTGNAGGRIGCGIIVLNK